MQAQVAAQVEAMLTSLPYASKAVVKQHVTELLLAGYSLQVSPSMSRQRDETTRSQIYWPY